MATNVKDKAADKNAAKKKAKTNVVAPTKRSMNFVRHSSSFNVRKMAPVLIIIAVALVLFAKFGLIDQIEKKSAAYDALARKQDQLAAYNLKLADYDKLAYDYGRYSYGWMNEDEVNAVDRLEIISIIENTIMNAATVQDFSINKNVISINLSGITLTEASAIVKQLEANELVQSATVYNATAENAEDAQIFMSIILEKEAE